MPYFNGLYVCGGDGVEQLYLKKIFISLEF